MAVNSTQILKDRVAFKSEEMCFMIVLVPEGEITFKYFSPSKHDIYIKKARVVMLGMYTECIQSI